MYLFSITDEKEYLSQPEDYKSSNNIVLRTTQSDKIAELSKKLEAQVKSNITEFI